MTEMRLVINDTEFTATVTAMGFSPRIPKLHDQPNSAECNFTVRVDHNVATLSCTIHPDDAPQVLKALSEGREQRG